MANRNRTEDPEPVSGELMPTNQNLPDVTTRNPLRRLFDQLFHLPLVNRRQKKSFESQREMVEEATKLGKALVDHQRTRDRLTNIDTLLNTDRAQRLRELVEEENRLNDALLENEAAKKKKRIYETNKNLEVEQAELKRKYELERQELEYKKSIAELEKQVAELATPTPSPARTRTRGRSEKQKKIDRAHKRLEKELEKIETMTATPERKEALRRSARRELEEELERIENTPQP
jgi:hypothetical protein